MAKAPPSFQFYPSDFIVGTMHLDHQAIACYLLLLCFQWAHRKLPSDVQELAKICRFDAQKFPAVWGTIADKFVDDGNGGLYNERLESVRSKALALSEKRAEVGRKGGQAIAKQKGKQKGKQKPSKGSMKYEDRSMNTEDRNLKTEDGSLKTDPFEEFWDLVPKKVAKKDCRKHYDAAVADLKGPNFDPHAYLRERMAEYAASPKSKSKYGWEPRSWLRDGHYDDDPATWEERSTRELSHNEKLLAELENGNGYFDETENNISNGRVLQTRLIEDSSGNVSEGDGRIDR